MHSPRNPDSSVVVEPGGSSLCGPHRLGAFALCPQLEAFAHDLHLRPVIEKSAPKIGTLVHGFLAYRYGRFVDPKTRANSERPDWLVYRDGYEYLDRAGASVPSFRDTAILMSRAYEVAFGPVEGEVWKPALVEYQFVRNIPTKHGPRPYSCRTDLLAWDISRGCYVIIDHKSMGKLPKATVIQERYATDRQMLTNIALARAEGYDIQGLLINGISREMPQPEFQIYEVNPNPLAFGRLYEDTQGLLERLAEIQIKYPNPSNRPRHWESCAEWTDEEYGKKHKFPFSSNFRCEYYGLCTGQGNWHDFVGREALTKR